MAQAHNESAQNTIVRFLALLMIHLVYAYKVNKKMSLIQNKRYFFEQKNEM